MLRPAPLLALRVRDSGGRFWLRSGYSSGKDSYSVELRRCYRMFLETVRSPQQNAIQETGWMEQRKTQVRGGEMSYVQLPV